jgi:hypothetical protein
VIWKRLCTNFGPLRRRWGSLFGRIEILSRSDYVVWELALKTSKISSLLSDDSRDENQLAKIVAAEAAGLTLLAELVASLKEGDHHGRQESVPAEAIAA